VSPFICIKDLMVNLIISFFIVASAKSNFLPETFSAKFEQVYISTLTKKEKKSFGALDYKFPGNIRFEVEKPNNILFVSNNKTNWIYRPPFVEGEPGELTIKKSEEIGLSGLLDTLNQGLEDNPQFKIDKKENRVKMIFNPKTSEKIGLKEGLLIFKKGNMVGFDAIEEIEITYPDEKKVSFKLSQINPKVTFTGEHFNFTPPKNTNITP
jgi:outer membrane lipoprotein-sorting protein